MPHMNDFDFPEYKFALSFLHTIEDNFEKQNQHKLEELSIPRE